MGDAISLTNWDAVVDELTGFSEQATVVQDTVTIQFEQAHITIRKDGYVSTGMPLHNFSHDPAAGPENVTIRVDEDTGELHVTADDVSYTFRKP